MARGQGRRRAPAQRQPAKQKTAPQDLDEIDKFHRSKDKLSLQLSDDELAANGIGSESDDEEAVFDLPAGDDSDDTSEDEDESDEEDLVDNDGEKPSADEDSGADSQDDRRQKSRIAACTSSCLVVSLQVYGRQNRRRPWAVWKALSVTCAAKLMRRGVHLTPAAFVKTFCGSLLAQVKQVTTKSGPDFGCFNHLHSPLP